MSEVTELTAIDPVETPGMIVTWDMGRYCNYDCTYCPPHRHDQTSPHALLKELQKAALFAFDYLSLMMPFRKGPTGFIFNLTGGEPTVHPQFVEFGFWLRKIHQEKYSPHGPLNITVTTNGAFGTRVRDSLLDNCDFATISYHCEASKQSKAKVRENIFYLQEKGLSLSVNVMFHQYPSYFEECATLCETLKSKEIKFIPRMIGEHKDNNRYHHTYTREQLAWMNNYWFAKKKQKTKGTMARDLGRPCCGGRELITYDAKDRTKNKTKFLRFARFKDWHCLVNWFFLHIDQQPGLIYTHQTCQARFDGTRGSLGTLKEGDKIIQELKVNLEKKEFPIITCPNDICGCGLCTPKSAKIEDFNKIIFRHLDTSILDLPMSQGL